MGNLIWFLFVGLVAGVIGKALMPGARNEPSGWVMTIVLGIVGAFVGGLLAGVFGIGAGNVIGQIIVAAIGSMIVIGLLRVFSGSRAI